MKSFIESIARNTPTDCFGLQPSTNETVESVDILKSKFPFADLESYLGSLLIYDGQRKNSLVDIYFGFFAMSAREIVLEVKMLNEIRVTCDDDYDEGYWTSYPEGTVLETVYSDRWFPFATDLCGNYLGIDFAPGPNGKIGQVIFFGRDIDERIVIADSLCKLEKWFVDIVVSSQFIVEMQVGLKLNLSAPSQQLCGTIQELGKYISCNRDI